MPVYLGRSLGVPIHTFLGLVSQTPISANLLKVEVTVPSTLNPGVIQAALNSRPPEQPTGTNVTAFDWLKYGNRLWQLGRFQEAVSVLDRAIQLKPNFYQAFFVKGLALYGQNQGTEAIAAFDAAIRLEPRFYEAWRMKAQAFEQMQQYPQALMAIDQAIQIQPQDSLLFETKGIREGALYQTVQKMLKLLQQS